MKKLLAILLSAVLALSLAACGDSHAPDTMSLDDFALIRESDGAVISYGMTRAEIEKLLGKPIGDPSQTYETYESGIKITYRKYPLIAESNGYNMFDQDHPIPEEEQVAVSISIFENKADVFKTVRGAALGVDRQEVVEAYGEKYDLVPQPQLSYYVYDLETKELMLEKPDNLQSLKKGDSLLMIYLSFKTSDDTLDGISVYDGFHSATSF